MRGFMLLTELLECKELAFKGGIFQIVPDDENAIEILQPIKVRDPLLDDPVVHLSDQGEAGRVRSCSLRVAMWLIGMVCRVHLLVAAALFSTTDISRYPGNRHLKHEEGNKAISVKSKSFTSI